MKFSFLRSSSKVLFISIIIGIVIGVVLCLRFFASHQGLRQPRDAQTSTIVSNEYLPLDMTVVSPQGVHRAVRVADTDAQRVLGLSHFPNLPEKQGMLFVFPQVGIYPFWMKDMNFPIDIIWIDDSGKIVYRVINADPAMYPETFTPSASARYVLEIPANTADRDGFSVGSRVQIMKTQ